MKDDSHELSKLESRIKLAYFLRDIGAIKTKLASAAWLRYMEMIAEIASSGVDRSV